MANDFIRQSQLVTTYGPGSMIDLPDYSVMVSGLDEWAYQRRERIDEPRLVAKLRRLLSVPALDLYTPLGMKKTRTARRRSVYAFSQLGSLSGSPIHHLAIPSGGAGA